MRKTWERTIATHTPDEDTEAGGQGEENRKKWITMRTVQRPMEERRRARMLRYQARIAGEPEGACGEEACGDGDV